MQVIDSSMSGEAKALHSRWKTVRCRYCRTTKIVPGEMDFVDANGEKITVAVSAGFTEVFNNRIKVFALTVERPEEIDIRRAEEAKERAEEQLRQKKSLEEYNANQMALARAMSRLRVTSRKRI